MRCKVLRSCKYGQPGEIADVPDTEARILIENGILAEVVEEKPAKGASIADYLPEEEPKAEPEGPKAEERKVKDLADVLPSPADMEGEQTWVDEILGKPIVIERFSMRKSRFGDGQFATVQISVDGEKRWFNTGSGPILDTLEQIQDCLPVRCKVARRKSAEGRRYYVLESAKE